MNASPIEFHNTLIAKNGIEAASGFSQQSRKVRFKIIARCLERFNQFKPGFKLLDYGCNDGVLLDFVHKEKYTGMDINPKFVAWAKKRWKSYVEVGTATFKVGDIMDDKVYKAVWHLAPDVIVASGILCYKENAFTYPVLVKRLFECARQGVILSLLVATTRKRITNDNIFRWTPEAVLKLLRHCNCPSWEVIYSYMPHDAMIVMRKSFTDLTR